MDLNPTESDPISTHVWLLIVAVGGRCHTEHPREAPRTLLSHGCHVGLPSTDNPSLWSKLDPGQHSCQIWSHKLGWLRMKKPGSKPAPARSRQSGTVFVYESQTKLLPPSFCLTEIGLTQLKGKNKTVIFIRPKVLLSKINLLITGCSGGPLISYQILHK